MHSSRKVRPPHSHGPYVGRAVLLGVVLGALGKLLQPVIRFCLGWSISDGILFQASLVLLAVSILTLMHTTCRHRLWCFLTGMVAATCITLVVTAFDASAYEIRDRGQQLGFLLAMLLAGVSGGCIAILMSRLFFVIAEGPLIQDGTMCPTCGYAVSHLSTNRCPECGGSFSDSQLEVKVASSLAEWRRLVMVGLSVFALLGMTYCLFPRVLASLVIRGVVPEQIAIDYLRFRPNKTIRLMRNFLAVGDTRERRFAAATVGFIGRAGVDAIDELCCAMLKDSDRLVRELAVQSLSNVSRDALREMMPQLLEDPAWEVRWAALAHLAGGGQNTHDEAIPFLIEALDDPVTNVRHYSYQRLTGNTGMRLPYNAVAERKQRLRDQAKWKAWWSGERVGQNR